MYLFRMENLDIMV